METQCFQETFQGRAGQVSLQKEDELSHCPSWVVLPHHQGILKATGKRIQKRTVSDPWYRRQWEKT